MDYMDILLFNDFETLDAMGPAEVFGHVDRLKINFISMTGGVITSAQGVKILTERPTNHLKLENQEKRIVLIPGGISVSSLLKSCAFMSFVEKLVSSSTYSLSVCTGAALLAETRMLNYKRAATNQRAFQWISSLYPEVKWDKNARWVKGEGYYTSAGVSAGIDMALNVVKDFYSPQTARMIAQNIEYRWDGK